MIKSQQLTPLLVSFQYPCLAFGQDRQALATDTNYIRSKSSRGPPPSYLHIRLNFFDCTKPLSVPISKVIPNKFFRTDHLSLYSTLASTKSNWQLQTLNTKVSLDFIFNSFISSHISHLATFTGISFLYFYYQLLSRCYSTLQRFLHTFRSPRLFTIYYTPN